MESDLTRHGENAFLEWASNGKVDIICIYNHFKIVCFDFRKFNENTVLRKIS